MQGGQNDERESPDVGDDDVELDVEAPVEQRATDAVTDAVNDAVTEAVNDAVATTPSLESVAATGAGGAPSVFDASPADTEAVPATPSPDAPVGPTLPSSVAKPPPPMVDPIAQPRPGAATWYRTDEERSKSVYRRANPWYRRLARGVIGLTFLAVAAVGLYAGARAVQGWLERDQLPAAGAEVPEIRSTSFIVTSEAPAPTLDGTLTIDTETLAFEFVGRAGGPQSGLQVVSADGSTVYLRQSTAPWRAATSTDVVATDVRIAVAYLADADTADTILTNRIRRGFVELDAQVDEGTGDDRLTRYEMTLDTQAFARDFPLQWQSFQDDAIPGAQQGEAVAVTIWLDTENVLMRVRDESASWSWERLVYGDQPFRPIDPANDTETRIVQVACVSDDDTIFWQTPFPSCDTALSAARLAADAAGVAGAFDDLDRTIARICSTMEREVGPLPATSDEAALAAALVDSDVCRGDPAIFTTN